jgi:phosphoglycolate phosphatase
MVGEGAAALIERAFAATGAPLQPGAADIVVRRYLEWYRQFPASDTLVFPGVPETLHELRAAGVALGVCTNKPHAMVAPVLEGTGLAGFFGAALGAGALPVKKPDPRHMHAVIEAIGGAPESAAYVGDGPTDCEAARAAKLPVVLVTYGYTRVPVRALKADAYIDRFADLPQALRALARETVR